MNIRLRRGIARFAANLNYSRRRGKRGRRTAKPVFRGFSLGGHRRGSGGVRAFAGAAPLAARLARFPDIKFSAFALCAFALVGGAAFGALKSMGADTYITNEAISGFPTLLECLVKYALPLSALFVLSRIPPFSPVAFGVLFARGASVGFTAAAIAAGGGINGALKGFAVLAAQNLIVTPAYLLAAVLAVQGFGFGFARDKTSPQTSPLAPALCWLCVLAAGLFEARFAPVITSALFAG